MSFVWWAVRGSSIDELAERLLEPAGYVRDPRWVSGFDLSDVTCCCMSLGEWSFVLVRGNDERDNVANFDTAFAEFSDVVRLEESDFDWAIIQGKRAGATVWSVYGASDDDFLRPEGDIPSTKKIDRILATKKDFELAPRKVGLEITGLDEDAIEHPDELRIVRFAREPFALVAPDDDLPAIEVTPNAEKPGDFEVSVEGVDGFDWQTVARGQDRLLVMSESQVLALVDTSEFPPVFTALATECTTAAFAPWGSMLLAIDDEQDTLLHEIDETSRRAVGLPFSKVQSYNGLHDVPGGVVAIPASWSDGEKVPCLVVEEGDQRTAIRIPVPANTGDDENAIVESFGDGSFLLVWEGQAYRWNRGELQAFGPLAADGDMHDQSATAADGSILVVANEELVQVWPDGRRETLQGFEGPTSVCPGLGGGTLVLDGITIKIVWTLERTITTFEDDDEEMYASVYYVDARRELLVALSGKDGHAIPWKRLAELPRTPL